MSDWTFIKKFGKEIANRAGVQADTIWNALLGGRLLDGPSKDKFAEEDMHGFSHKLRQWITNHPKEVATLVARIAAALTAVSLTPAMIAMLGLGPLGPVAGARAALAQAAMGPVMAGSAFAILQSAGMGGLGLTVVKTIAASGSMAITCSAAAVRFLGAMKKEKCSRE